MRLDCMTHGLKIVAEILCRNGNQFGTCRKRGQRVNRESMLRKNRRTTRSEENPGNEVEHIV